jgi:hypothetical protein
MRRTNLQRRRTVMARSDTSLDVLDEFTHECLAIRGRPQAQGDRCDRRSIRPVHPAGRSRLHPVRQRTGVPRQGGTGMDRGCGCQDRLQRGSPWENGYIESLKLACATAKSSTLSARPKSSSRAGGATTTRSGRTHRSDTGHQHRRYLSLPSPRGRLRYANRLRRPRLAIGQPIAARPAPSSRPS